MSLSEIVRNSIHDLPLEVVGETKTTISLLLENGDWKHGHLYLDFLMKAAGFKKVSEKTTEENGSDCYSSIHKFKYIRG